MEGLVQLLEDSTDTQIFCGSFSSPKERKIYTVHLGRLINRCLKNYPMNEEINRFPLRSRVSFYVCLHKRAGFARHAF